MQTHHLAAPLVIAAAMSVRASGEIFALYGSQTTGTSATWGLVKLETNPVNGRSARVGNGGLMGDMDFDSTGVLYAPSGSSGLTRVDTTTGAQTLIGGWGLGDKTINAIAFSPDGTLYAVDNEGTSTSLYTIDTQTGQATRVGAVGNYVFGLDFGPDGTLYGASADVFTINPVTGSQGKIVVPYSGTGLPITVLDYGADRVFRAYTPANLGLLLEIHPDTQSVGFIGPSTEYLRGLASVPAPGAAAVLAISGIGIAQRRRTAAIPSSPTWTRTKNLPVNSRSLYH